MPGQFSWDYQDFPLVVIRYVGTITDAEFESYLWAYRALLDRGEPYAIVLDASLSGVPSAAQRKMQGKFIKDHEEPIANLCLGGAFVITQPVIRGALTAILWIAELPFENTVVPDIYSAADWACARLKKSVPQRFLRQGVTAKKV